MGDSQQLHTTAMKQSLIIILVAVAAISLATQDFDEDVTPVPEDEVSASASTSELTESSLQRGRRVHPAHKKKRLARWRRHIELVHKHVKKKAWKKYNRWGELTESKFGHFKKHHSWIHARARYFERVHKKYVKRAKKAAKRLKKHRKSRYRRGWGELTESKFGLFKKHFERVHKKYFKRANKAAKRLKKHRKGRKGKKSRCRSRRYRYIRRTGRCIRRKHGMGFKYKKYKNRKRRRL